MSNDSNKIASIKDLADKVYIEVNTMSNDTYYIGNENVNTGSGNINIAARDNNINSPHDNGTDVKDLLEELKQLIENYEQIDSEEKALVIDDIEVISEQTEAEQPNKTRLKKAWENIIKFIVKLPMAIEGAVKIKENIEKLQPILSKMVEGLPALPHIGL